MAYAVGMAHTEDRKTRPRPHMAELARLASERETARLAGRDRRRQPLTRLADLARAAQRRTVQERGWPSR